MSYSPVLIVGAGPVGLALALGLARHGVRSVLLEKKETTGRTSRAPGLHVRTREVLRHWGVEERFLAAGELWRSVTLHDVGRGAPMLSLGFGDLAPEADAPGLLIVEQNETERLLLGAVRETGLCDVRFGSEAVALQHDDQGVRLTVQASRGTEELTTSFAVGCDGADSFVRRALELPFDGMTYSLRPMLADVAIADERDSLPQPRVLTRAGSYRFAARLRPGLWRIVHLPHGEPEKEDVPAAEVMQEVERLIGPGPAEVLWSSRFRIHVRSSPRFRVGRVLLAGDAAHVHSPASGHGLNGGIHDAHNLAWKLAASLGGGDTHRLLDSYDVERRAVVVEETSRYTDRVTRIFIQSPALLRMGAFLVARAALGIDRLRRSYLRRLAMLDLDYPASPLLRHGWRARGVRLPNPLLRSPAGDGVRLYELLPNAPVLIDVAEERPFSDDLPLRDVIRVGPGGYEEPTRCLRELLGGHDGWILVRPDAHVAWARRRRERMEELTAYALGTA